MSRDEPLSAPQPLGDHHIFDDFDCGADSLNQWLRNRARPNQSSGASRTFVVCRGQHVVGYSALAAGSICTADAPSRYRRNMPDPIPAMVLGRLAIDLREQKKGIGAALLKDVMLRAQRAGHEHGIAVILVHAIDEKAKQFYLKFGFRQSATNDMTLLARVEDIRLAIGA